MTRWLSSDEQRLWRAWIAVNAELERGIEEDLASSGLTAGDYEILAHLSESPDGELRMSELASQILFSKSRLTYRISQLEARGYVERCDAEDDGRGVIARLTRTGRRAIEAAAPSHVTTVREALIDHLRPGTLRALRDDLEALLKAHDREPHGHGDRSSG